MAFLLLARSRPADVGRATTFSGSVQLGAGDNWIHSAYTYIGLRADGYPMYRAASGNVYTDEGSHWDIAYYTCGC